MNTIKAKGLLQMKTLISLTINGLIRGQCYNFLSYLYIKNGWKRTMFDMAKEISINSHIQDKNIRIIITNVGVIMLTCYSMADIIKSIEFIISEFEYGRMGYYIAFDEKVNLKTHFTTTIPLIDYFYEEREVLTSKFGNCSIYQNLITLEYESYDDGFLLISKIRDVFFLPDFSLKSEERDDTDEILDTTNCEDDITESQKEAKEIADCEDNTTDEIESQEEEEDRREECQRRKEHEINISREFDIKTEAFIFSALLLWFSSKMCESLILS